ncbi:MAG: phenylacetate--CoA ligase family protein, partial [Clostridia bacterium]
PLSLYAIIKEVHGIQRFQLIQTGENQLELRLVGEDRSQVFIAAKQAIECYLLQNGVVATVHLSELLPQANPMSGKFKHIVAL